MGCVLPVPFHIVLAHTICYTSCIQIVILIKWWIKILVNVMCINHVKVTSYSTDQDGNIFDGETTHQKYNIPAK